MSVVKIGIIGLGTVGSGVFNILGRNSLEISRRAGLDIEVFHVGARRDNPACDTSNVTVSRNVEDTVNDESIDIIVELIGGTDLAKKLVLKAIENGKHVVTANKALIAEHGNEIFAAAEKKNVAVCFESAVAGGVPIIKALREGLSANKIAWLAGIINGTGNFILTEMRDKGSAFDDVLKDAQELGYAEADPTFDVEGIDAAHKLAILASLAFGMPLQFDKIYTEGITDLTAEDISYAEELGFSIKHLGIARNTETGVELRVHPTLIPKHQLMANVDGVLNAVLVSGDAVAASMYSGPGAGSEATASAVIADIIDIARARNVSLNQRVPALGFQLDKIEDIPVLPMEEIYSAYYLRLQVEEKPGVLAQITEILKEKGISIEAILQKPGLDKTRAVPVIILTEKVQEKYMNKALEEIGQLDALNSDIIRIRLETLD